MKTTINDILYEIRLKAETEKEKGTEFERLIKRRFQTVPLHSQAMKIKLIETKQNKNI